GLCTQTNNALIINSPEVAKRYITGWNAIKADTEAADRDQKKLQPPTQRTFNRTNNANSISAPIKLPDGVTVEVMFSPNTEHTLKSPHKEARNDMKRLFDRLHGASETARLLSA